MAVASLNLPTKGQRSSLPRLYSEHNAKGSSASTAFTSSALIPGNLSHTVWCWHMAQGVHSHVHGLCTLSRQYLKTAETPGRLHQVHEVGRMRTGNACFLFGEQHL